VCSISDEAEIGFVIFVQRGGHADDDGVHLGDLRIVRGRGKAPRAFAAWISSVVMR
jgi:hypothetical protein